MASFSVIAAPVSQPSVRVNGGIAVIEPFWLRRLQTAHVDNWRYNKVEDCPASRDNRGGQIRLLVAQGVNAVIHFAALVLYTRQALATDLTLSPRASIQGWAAFSATELGESRAFC